MLPGVELNFQKNIENIGSKSIALREPYHISEL
jgi:hypothetical protein